MERKISLGISLDGEWFEAAGEALEDAIDGIGE